MTVKAWLLAGYLAQLVLAKQKTQTTEITVIGEQYNLTYEGQSRDKLSIKWIAESDSLIVKLQCRNCFFAKDSHSKCRENSPNYSDGSLSINKSCTQDSQEQFAYFSFEENICKKSKKISTISGIIKCESKKEELVALSTSTVTVLAIISFLAILISSLALVIYALNFRQNQRENGKYFNSTSEKEKFLTRSTPCISNYSPESLSIVKTVIEGDFGSCLIGKIEIGDETRRVFVKQLKDVKDQADVQARAKLFENLKACDLILKVNLTSYHEKSFQAIYFQPTEGPLKWFLKRCQLRTNPSQRSTVTTEKLRRFTFQGAQALAYLSSNQIIHGDVGARNFVLDEFNENIILSDTIISVDLFPADYFEGRPIRWQAPECIETANHSSLSGDVWAFGIFVWELFSLEKSYKFYLS
ncbi:unnamed protein product [Oikopleura dioica]|uniref:Protein kinase domain-containing protein n=1 Tax=Oikopleura dioica TaxID=34765 RepID=E4XS23_OIKDI|nr:unnamed protein product [Oikopleura dioica]